MTSRSVAALAMAASLLAGGCATTGFRVKKQRATYSGEAYLLEMEEPTPRRDDANPEGWSLSIAQEDRAAWTYANSPDADPSKVVLVIALEDTADAVPGRVAWVHAWRAGPGFVGSYAAKQVATRVDWEGAATREHGETRSVDVAPIRLDLDPVWTGTEAATRVAGHLACRLTRGVPIVVCVLGGPTVNALPEGPIESYFATPEMKQNEVWVRSLLEQIKAVPKPAPRPVGR